MVLGNALTFRIQLAATYHKRKCYSLNQKTPNLPQMFLANAAKNDERINVPPLSDIRLIGIGDLSL